MTPLTPAEHVAPSPATTAPPEDLGSAPDSESPTPLVKGDGETWEDYSHRLEHRIKEQRDHIKAITELRNEPGDRVARKRIEWLERSLGSMTLRWEKVTADFAGYRQTTGKRRMNARERFFWAWSLIFLGFLLGVIASAL